jgi:hypothetical protein
MGFRLPLSAPLFARTPARCRFLLGTSVKTFLPNPAGGKEKVRFLGSGNITPGSQLAKDERAGLHLG